jgi:hypothetical protein
VKIAEAAEVVLKNATSPMHARDIAAAIEEKKLFTFQTTDNVSVVSKALRKSEKFTKTGPSTFTLRKA